MTSGSCDILLVMITVPERATAERIAEELVRRRLAACVNIVSELKSIYRWEGKLNRDPELLLLVKTTDKALQRLKECIVQLHPYKLPEIIAVRVQDGLEAYLDWVRSEVDSASSTRNEVNV